MAPYRRQEPPELDLAPEEPTLLREILDLHRNTFGYGLPEFSKMLNATQLDLVSTYGLGQTQAETRQRLRLIRSSQTA